MNAMFAALWLLPALLQGSDAVSTIVLYDGTATGGQDPLNGLATLTTPWTQLTAGQGISAGASVVSAGCSAWLINDSPSQTEYRYYTVDFTAEQEALAANGLGLHMRLRFAEGATGSPHGQTMITTVNDKRYWLAFSRCANGELDIIVNYASVQQQRFCYPDANGAAFLYYFIRHEAGSPTAELFIDGALQATFTPSTSTGKEVQWGDIGSRDDSGYWNLVKVDVCEAPGCTLAVPVATGTCPAQSPHSLQQSAPTTTSLPDWPAAHPVASPGPSATPAAAVELVGVRCSAQFGLEAAPPAFIALDSSPGVLHIAPALYVDGVDVLATLTAMNGGQALPGRGSFDSSALPPPNVVLQETGSAMQLGPASVFHASDTGSAAIATGNCLRIAGYDLRELIALAGGAEVAVAGGVPVAGAVLLDVPAAATGAAEFLFGVGEPGASQISMTYDATSQCLTLENHARAIQLMVDGVDVLGFLREFFAAA